MAKDAALSNNVEQSGAVDTQTTFTGPDQPMWINGEAVESTTGEWRDVQNPAHRGTIITRVPAAGTDDVDRAVAAGELSEHERQGDQNAAGGDERDHV